MTNKQHRALNLILISLAVGLRLFNLGRAPLWYDEAFSDLATRLPLSEMFRALAGDVHPPGHYLLLWPLQQLGLGSPFWLRLLSALASIASVILAGRLALLLTDNPWAETVTMGLMAFAPGNLHYAQEARMYALLQMVVLIGAISIHQRKWGLLAVSAAVASLTHNYGLFFCLGLFMACLATAQDQWRGWIPAFCLAGLIWLPWGVVMLNQMRHLNQAGYWIQPVSVGRVLGSIQKMFFTFALPNEQTLATMIMLGAGLVILVAYLIRSRDQSKQWISLVIMAGVPLLLAVLVSWLYRPILLYRPLMGSLPFWLILATMTILSLNKSGRILSAALLIPLLTWGVFGFHVYNLQNKASSDFWIQGIRADWQPGSVVYTLNDSAALAMLHGAPELPSYKMPDCPGQASLGALTPLTRDALGINELPVDELPERYFVVLSLSPVSPACEVDFGEQTAAEDQLLMTIHENQFIRARVYLHE